MPSPARLFRRFNTEADAGELAGRLRDAGLHPIVRENTDTFDVTFSAGIAKEWHVVLPAHEFEQAETWLEADEDNDITAMPEDHYLRSFTEEELMDVVRKSDEWAPHDRAWARALLVARGRQVSAQEQAGLRKERVEELGRPEKASLVLLGTAVCLVLFGGFAGMVIGWSLRYAYKTLPDGNRVPRYTQSDRESGTIILVAGGSMLLLSTWFVVTKVV